VEKTVEKTVELILIEMSNNSKITIKELSKITGLSRRGVEYNINKLKEEGKIRRIGSDRGGNWKVIKTN
jgi:ATP-dependent DNA helicase RecG